MDKDTALELMATVKKINQLPEADQALLHVVWELCDVLASQVSEAIEWEAERDGWYRELGAFMEWGERDAQ